MKMTNSLSAWLRRTVQTIVRKTGALCGHAWPRMMQIRTGGRIRHMVLVSFLGVGFVGLGIAVSEGLIRRAARNRLYASADTIPHRSVGIVLGCSKTLANGRRNLYFSHRVAAAEKLFTAGKVDFLVVSGDNHRKGYDEPTDMKDALLARGIPAAAIQCDYAGFRTLDSIIRAREVFCCDQITVISQRFHAERAVFIGLARGVDVIAFPARDVSRRAGLRTQLRERLARVKAVLDVGILRKQPKFLGEKIPVVTRMGDAPEQ